MNHYVLRCALIFACNLCKLFLLVKAYLSAMTYFIQCPLRGGNVKALKLLNFYFLGSFISFSFVWPNCFLCTDNFHTSLPIATLNLNLTPTCQFEKDTSAYKQC